MPTIPIRRQLLKDLNLHEVSLVTAGANQHARIALYKSAEGAPVEKSTEGVQFNIGFPEDGSGSEIQSVVFDSSKWDVEKAKEWLKKHNLKVSKVDETENTLRFRQKDPALYKRFRMVTPGEGVAKCLGPFTFDQALKAVNEAVRQKYDPQYHNFGIPVAVDSGYVWIREVYEDHAIFEQDGQIFSVPFTFGVDNGALKATLDADREPVVVAYIPVGEKTMDTNKSAEEVVKEEVTPTETPVEKAAMKCKDCGKEYESESNDKCPECGSTNVESVKKANEEVEVTKTEPTLADVLAAIQSVAKVQQDQAESITNLAASHAETKNVVDGLVQKSEDLDGKLKATVIAPPVPGDTPGQGSHTVRKQDDDPRTGCFDTAFIRKRR
jgi:predicted  nucleic acid-binding Zn-ribbon protein